MFIKTLSVSSLNNYIKKSMDIDFILSNLQVEGEISNLKLHSSGHIYFSLKDDKAKINCIMFRSDSENLTFIPENGMKVIVKGRVSVYEKEGTYQLYCREMEEQGLGKLHIEFQKLKERLLKEGYFDEEHKKAMPAFPKKIGVITSPTGAAIRDIINVSKRRNPNMEIIISPCLVQGENAPKSIIKALSNLSEIEGVEGIIIGRGGGSIEELWAFNDEDLAKAVYKCKIPIISGVGHETDYTIIDFVSDMRAPTPSAAAEILVPNFEDEMEKLQSISKTLNMIIRERVEKNKSRLENISYRLELSSPKNYIANQYLTLDSLHNRLKLIVDDKMKQKKEELSKKVLLLDAYNPLNVLKKGYSIIENQDRKVMTNRSMVEESEFVHIRMRDEEIKGRIHILEEE